MPDTVLGPITHKILALLGAKYYMPLGSLSLALLLQENVNMPNNNLQ